MSEKMNVRNKQILEKKWYNLNYKSNLHLKLPLSVKSISQNIYFMFSRLVIYQTSQVKNGLKVWFEVMHDYNKIILRKKKVKLLSSQSYYFPFFSDFTLAINLVWIMYGYITNICLCIEMCTYLCIFLCVLLRRKCKAKIFFSVYVKNY